MQYRERQQQQPRQVYHEETDAERETSHVLSEETLQLQRGSPGCCSRHVETLHPWQGFGIAAVADAGL